MHSSASGRATSTNYFPCSGGPGAVFINSAPGRRYTELVFCIRWGLRSRSVFWCIQGTKHWCTIFHARWAWCGFRKKHPGTCHAKLMFLHPVGSVGHIVHSGVSRLWNVDALFFLVGYARCCFHKKRLETCYAELVILYPVGYAGHVVHSGASSLRNINALFFLLRWAWCGFHKKHLRICYAELVFLYTWVCESRSAFGLWNIDVLFFMLGWALCGFHKKSASGQVTPNLCFYIRWYLWVPVCPGHQTSTQYLSCSGGPIVVSIKSALGHVTLNLCFCIRWELQII
jgi:hypothetical protein